ncbi:MAG: hypothetical protein AAF228_03005 [Pseudomonadota bacterium]
MVSVGNDGLVVIQAEDTQFKAPWNERKVEGRTILEWDSPTDSFTQPQDTLEYEFTVDEAGDYFFSYYGYRDDTGEPDDRNNDFFISLKDSDGNTILTPTKVFFGGQRESFQWGTTFDKNHKKSDAKFEDLEPGETYILEVSGRSRDAAFDRMHLSTGDHNTDPNAPVSPTTDDIRPEPEPPVNDPAPDPVQEKPSVDLDFYLLDADTGKLVGGELGDDVDLDPAGNYSMVVIPEGDINQISRVEITVNGETQVENAAPYAAFGDMNGEYTPGDFDAGSNKITAVAYDRNGNQIGSESQEFVVEFDGVSPPMADPEPILDPANPDPGQIPNDPGHEPLVREVDFDLFAVDAETDQVLFEIKDGDKLSEGLFEGREVSFLAIQDNGEQIYDIGSVTVDLNGNTRTENYEPYVLHGDNMEGDVFRGQTVEVGEYSISLEAFSGKAAAGTVLGKEIFDFDVVGDGSQTVDSSSISEVETRYLEDVLGYEVYDQASLDY